METTQQQTQPQPQITNDSPFWQEMVIVGIIFLVATIVLKAGWPLLIWVAWYSLDPIKNWLWLWIGYLLPKPPVPYQVKMTLEEWLNKYEGKERELAEKIASGISYSSAIKEIGGNRQEMLKLGRAIREDFCNSVQTN